ncbi:MAG: hypothetical protein K2X27_10420 [Candidatus Obscuribacterales bacterium]|nr:hypothetical protein [Candidatus Obscuribacterales bacterium]
MGEIRQNRIEDTDDETIDDNNTLNLVNLTDSSISNTSTSNTNPQSFNLPALDISSSTPGTEPESHLNSAGEPSNSLTGGPRPVPESAPLDYRPPLLGLGGPLGGNGPSIFRPAPSEMDIITDRWQYLSFPGQNGANPGQASQDSINQAMRDLPRVLNSLDSGDSRAAQILSAMQQRGIPVELIRSAILQRTQQGMAAATDSQTFRIAPGAVPYLAALARQDSYEGRSAMQTLLTLSRGAQNISPEASASAVGGLRMLMQDQAGGGRERFLSATRTESNSYLNNLQNRLRNNENVPIPSPLQSLLIDNGLRQGDASALEAVSRLAAGQGGNQDASAFNRFLLLSHLSSTPSNQRQQVAEQAIRHVLQAGPNEQALELTNNLASRYPQAVTSAVESLRTQLSSTDASSRDSAYSQLAYIAAGGFGQNAASQSARGYLLREASNPEGRQRVLAALDANANRGLRANELSGIRRSVETLANQPSDQQQTSDNQNRLMRDLFPQMTPEQITELRQQAASRHGEAAFQRFLANAQMYQNASPELRRYLASSQALPANPGASDNLLAPFTAAAPQLDMGAALRQFAQGDLQGSNQVLNNAHERMSNLVSGIQRQLGANETAIAGAHSRYSESMTSLASRLTPREPLPPTLGPSSPSSPETTANEYFNRAQRAQQDITRLSQLQAERQSQLNIALGTQLLGSHALLRQQNPAAADSLAIMANNYLPSHQLPAFLRSEVRGHDGSPGPALLRAESRSAAIGMNPNNPTDAREIIRRSAALEDNGRDSLTRGGLTGMDILQGLSSGVLRVDAAQLQAEARAAQVYGAARTIMSRSDALMDLNARFNDLSALQSFAGIGRSVANSERAIREFVASEFEGLQNLIGPRPYQGPRVISQELGGAVDMTPNPQREFDARRAEVGRQRNAVETALSEMTAAQRNSVAGQELQMRARGLEALQNLMNPNSQLNADLRRLTSQFRDQNVSMSEEFLRQAAPIIAELAIAAAASALVPGLGTVAALGRAGRIATVLMNNPIVRNAIKDEVMGVVHSLNGTGNAGPLSQYFAGRIDAATMSQNVVNSQLQNATYGRLTGSAQNAVADALGRQFRFGAQIARPVLTPVSSQANNGLNAAVNQGVQFLLPS